VSQIGYGPGAQPTSKDSLLSSGSDNVLTEFLAHSGRELRPIITLKTQSWLSRAGFECNSDVKGPGNAIIHIQLTFLRRHYCAASIMMQYMRTGIEVLCVSPCSTQRYRRYCPPNLARLI